MSEIIHKGWLHTRENNEKFVPYTLSTSIRTPQDESYVEVVEDMINKKPGLVVTGQEYTYDQTILEAGEGAEAFNDIDNNQAIGNYSHAEGYMTTAVGEQSHAEGERTIAAGKNSHAEGYQSEAIGSDSHAEGESRAFGIFAHAEGSSAAYGDESHSEGVGVAKGDCSHAEGASTAEGEVSHAEGSNTHAKGNYSHAEGFHSKAEGDSAHAEGNSTVASGQFSHSEGGETTAAGNYSHTEGYKTSTEGAAAHAEGYQTAAYGNYAHSEGEGTIARGASQHVEGRYNIEDTENKYAHIVGNGSSNSKSNAHTLDWDGNAWYAGDLKVDDSLYMGDKLVATEVWVDNKKPGLKVAQQSYQISLELSPITLSNEAEFNANTNQKYYYDADKDYYRPATSFMEGTTEYFINGAESVVAATGAEIFNDLRNRLYVENTIVSGLLEIDNQPVGNVATGSYSHAEGRGTTASGSESHAEGQWTIAAGPNAHAEGQGCIAERANGAHAEGVMTRASGSDSVQAGSVGEQLCFGPHAEGTYTIAKAQAAHAEGSNTVASGLQAHSEGSHTYAVGNSAHAEGKGTYAIGNYSHAEGYGDNAIGYAYLTGTPDSYTYSFDEGDNFELEVGMWLLYKDNIEQIKSIDVETKSLTLSDDTFGSLDNAEVDIIASEGMAEGHYSHSEGYRTYAQGAYSHAAGYRTIAKGSSQTVIGKYNVADDSSLFIIGKGTSENERKNAFSIDELGNIVLSDSSYGEENPNDANIAGVPGQLYFVITD